jgi:hypothetical protein
MPIFIQHNNKKSLLLEIKIVYLHSNIEQSKKNEALNVDVRCLITTNMQ